MIQPEVYDTLRVQYLYQYFTTVKVLVSRSFPCDAVGFFFCCRFFFSSPPPPLCLPVVYPVHIPPPPPLNTDSSPVPLLHPDPHIHSSSLTHLPPFQPHDEITAGAFVRGVRPTLGRDRAPPRGSHGSTVHGSLAKTPRSECQKRRMVRRGG